MMLFDTVVTNGGFKMKTIKNCFNNKGIYKAAIAIIASTMMFGCQDYWPTEGWRSAEPEEKGMNSAKLQQAQELAEESNVWGMLVIKDGYIVSEGYYNGGAIDLSARVNSVTKSIVSLSAGIAQDRGYIDIDQNLSDYFPEYINQNSDEWEQDIIIEDLLTMSWGYDWDNFGEMKPGGKYWQWYAAPDQLQYAVDRDQAAVPGEVWNYDCTASQFISSLIGRTTGQNTLEFTQENLFNPLGINNLEGEETQWSSNANGGYTDGAFGLYLTPRQLAKIGLLIINKGYWDGEQIVSRKWVKESISPLIETGFGSGFSESYGLHWWNNGDYFFASGLGGQYLIVYPESEMIIVLTSQANVPAALDPTQTLSTANMTAIRSLVADAVITEETAE